MPYSLGTIVILPSSTTDGEEGMRNGTSRKFLEPNHPLDMGKRMEPAYVKGFLVEALINAMPLRETNAVVDRLLPAICREL